MLTMKRLKFLVTSLILLICVSVSAQETEKKVLFTINDVPFYSDEFIRVYNKNLELVKDESQKDLDNYLELFIGYKLKITKAMQMGLQEDKKYQGELNSYRNQLAKKYLTDNKVTEELILEGYNRSLKEVKHRTFFCLLTKMRFRQTP